MVTEVNSNYCGDHFVINTNIVLLTNMMLNVNYTSTKVILKNTLGPILEIPTNWPKHGLSPGIFFRIPTLDPIFLLELFPSLCFALD